MTREQPEQMESLRSPEDLFRNGYYYFVRALEVLASDPAEACRLMGDFNVGWEIKDDVGAGRFLLGKGFLGKDEEAWISKLLQELENVSVDALPAGCRRDDNLRAMADPQWKASRLLARETLFQLKPFSEANAKALGL